MNRFAFLPQSADRARLPVALLSGFLGSGKTTLVNALLKHPAMAGTAVAVNEFGEVPLDHDLIDHGDDQTIVMANGCLCCNLAGDMEDAVMRLFSRRGNGELPRFQRLIIEPSGLSDPAPIAQAILRNPVMSALFRLEAIVTVVDAVFGEMQLGRHPETRKQAALADRLVLAKRDQAPDDQALQTLRAELRAQNPIAPILESRFGSVEPAALFPPSFFDPDAPVTPRSVFFADDADPEHTGRCASVSLTAPGKLLWRPFEAWLRQIRIAHAENLFRVKGMLDVEGADGPVIVQGLHHVIDAPVERDAWPAGERKSRLVLIADRATIEAARHSWAEALPAMTAPT
jgi:G3E family GTPase